MLAVADALGHYERALALWDRVADPETVAGVERPVLLERAAEAASGAGEHDLAIRYVDAAIGELEHAPAPRRRRLGLLCERKTWYLGRAGRWAESLEMRPSAPWRSYRPNRRPRNTPPSWLRSPPALAIGQERYEEASRVATADARGGAPSRCPQAGGRSSQRPW